MTEYKPEDFNCESCNNKTNCPSFKAFKSKVRHQMELEAVTCEKFEKEDTHD